MVVVVVVFFVVNVSGFINFYGLEFGKFFKYNVYIKFNYYKDFGDGFVFVLYVIG